MCLPHKLLPWIKHAGLWPQMDPSSVEQYWNHMRAVGKGYAADLDASCAPMWLWADAATFNKANDSLLVICTGLVLDERSNSAETCWPLAVLRNEACHESFCCARSYAKYDAS